MNRLLLTIAVGALCATGLAAQKTDPPQGQATEQSDEARLKAESDARWQRLQAQHQATEAARRAEQARYEQSLRDAAAARARYEQDVRAAEAARVRYEADVARSNRRRAEYDRQMAERAEREARRTRNADRQNEERAAPTPAPVRTATSAGRTCEQQRDRSRRRGRGIGSVVGGIAGNVIGGPAGGVANVVTSVLPVGALLGEAIASLLDCDEQQKAANATEEAVRGGVGTTSTWTSETRPGVTGSSTVTAADPAASSDPCLTVTDIVIIEGEETRVPKRMCRRPPANRYVRV